MSELLESYKNFNPRLRLFYALVGLIMLVLLGGLGYRQLISGPLYSQREEIQNLRRVLVPGPRGNIFDRNGELLVGNRPRFAAVVYLAELRSEFRTEFARLRQSYLEAGESLEGVPLQEMARASVVQRYLDEINELIDRGEEVNSRTLERHLRQQLILPYFLINDLTPEEYARLLEQIPIDSPVQVYSSSVRYYPHGAAASHALGYVGSTLEIPEEDVPGENLMTFNIRGSQGRSGLELQFNDLIQGVTGGEIWVVDPGGFQHQRVMQQKSRQGQDIVTSLDIEIQKVAEQALADYHGAVAALDPNTGEVLALATSPGYDLNAFTPALSSASAEEITETGAWPNRTAQGLYPPGSTFKMITAMAALKNGIIGTETTSYCRGSINMSGRTFHCHNRAGHGEVNVVEALKISCNVFFYEHGLRTGVEKISEEARRFGLHEKTGIELPSETGRMLIGNPEWKRRVHHTSWFPGDTVNLSIGQGFIRVTPLQMAAFIGAFATGRERIHPTLILNRKKESESPPLLVSARHYHAVINGMVEAVASGTARNAAIPGVEIAGKTGTAQVRAREGTLHMAWFVGFAPVNTPEIALAVLVEGTHPDDNYGGGRTAAPIAREVFRTFFQQRDSDSLAESAGATW